MMHDEATQRGIDNLMKTFGCLPDTFRVMLEQAPAAFAGYTTMRAFVMRDRDEGAALDLRAKERVFVLLDVQMGNVTGAKFNPERSGPAGTRFLQGCLAL